MKPSDVIVLGGAFKVACLNKADGKELWETTLVTGFFNVGETYVSLVIEGNLIFAHTKNEVFCLALETGNVLWNTKLPNLGRAIVSIAIAGSRSSQDDAADVIRLRAAQSSSD